jgi:tripartite-type tricarboxylate transporter receptor subunit TctC
VASNKAGTRDETMLRTLMAALFAAAFSTTTVLAQDTTSNYPNRPIKIIVCVPAGGGVDTVTRVIAEGLEKELGQPVVVENRDGASGNIGANVVYHSDPDGYTLLAAQPSPLTVNPLLYKTMTFDPTQFEPVSIMSEIPNVLLVRPTFPAKTAKELIAYARANPGKINYASQGIGTTSHLTAALFEHKTGTTMVNVPFKGTSPALNSLIGDHVDMIFMELSRAIELHKAGQARILAVASLKRLPQLSDIPTLDEIGIQGFESGTFNTIVAPPKTPKAIVDRLNEAVTKVKNSPKVRELFAKLDLEAPTDTPAQAKAFINEQTKLWGAVIKEAHVAAH